MIALHYYFIYILSKIAIITLDKEKETIKMNDLLLTFFKGFFPLYEQSNSMIFFHNYSLVYPLSWLFIHSYFVSFFFCK